MSLADRYRSRFPGEPRPPESSPDDDVDLVKVANEAFDEAWTNRCGAPPNRKGGDHAAYGGPEGACPRCSGPATPGERKFGGEQFIAAGIRCWYGNLDGQGPDWLLRSCGTCGHYWPEELPEPATETR